MITLAQSILHLVVNIRNRWIEKKEPTMSEAYGCFDPGKHAPEYDIGLELGIARKQLDEDISQLGELDDNSYRDMVRNLNVQQKEFFNHVLHWH